MATQKSKMKAYINIGTNLGDRLANINRAISLIESQLNCTARRSDIIESEPWGYQSQNSFLNIGIAIDTPLTPIDLLHTLQRIEKSICADSHRTPQGQYADRIIDIDIMAIENTTLNTPELTLPHPHLLDRPFFLTPYTQLTATP